MGWMPTLLYCKATKWLASITGMGGISPLMNLLTLDSAVTAGPAALNSRLEVLKGKAARPARLQSRGEAKRSFEDIEPFPISS